jgi:hypothetical protein
MSELGDLLELLHRARDRWTTVRATIRSWRHLERSGAAWQAWQESRAGGAWTHFGVAGSAEPEPETRETVTRLWIESDRIREENEGHLSHLGIKVGRLWWHYSDEGGAVSNEDNPEGGTSGVGEEFRHLFDPSQVSGGARFEILGGATVAGRDGIRVRALPRETDDPHRDLHLLFAADEHDLVVDAERGVLLRLAGRFRGEEFHVHELQEIAFDEQFEDDLFVFRPPAGERVRQVGPALRMRVVSIDEAQREASFTVWIPRGLDPGWQLRAHLMPADDRPSTPEAVFIHYFRDDASHQFSINERAAGEQDEFAGDWEELERSGERLLVASEPQTRARVEREGTEITIHSQDLELERLFELVDLLVPASSEPPPLAADG